MFIGKFYKISMLLLILMSFFSFGLNAQVRKELKMTKAEKVKTYDEVVSDLQKNNKEAAKQLVSWKTAKNFLLTKEGNFIPYYPSGSGINQSDNQVLSATPVNCAKIPCPDIFKPDVVCWECH
ncbi:hypothetical protein [Christiangramia forsetii]|uniref:Secreted protein n=2 Tax=Christiangramia forsetii TaxID=411153 RepID=A0LXB7_CHRFK|nr:hypothetical protein [Christiangramia forsetii]GGG27658.1 hypothetical protein GCM10011532_08820 [Christiangramia forsetii]CAL65012.1 secreted protein [Christiangramia forsetii KT0803]